MTVLEAKNENMKTEYRKERWVTLTFTLLYWGNACDVVGS